MPVTSRSSAGTASTYSAGRSCGLRVITRPLYHPKCMRPALPSGPCPVISSHCPLLPPQPRPGACQLGVSAGWVGFYECAGAGADPVTGQAVDAPALRARLLDHVYPALSDHGDTETVTTLLRRLDDLGTGADRQRALFTSAASTPAFITALARADAVRLRAGPLAARCPVPAAGRRAVGVWGRAVQDPPPSPGALTAKAVAQCQ